MKATTFLLVLAVSSTACSTHRNTAQHPSADRNVITHEEMQSASLRTAYDAVHQLRPLWLRTRGSDTFSGGRDPIVLYMNGARIGTISQLRDIPINDVQEIRFLDAIEATRLYGTGHRSGAITVRTRSS